MSNGNGHSWSKFCWRDWSADKALHPCSLAAKGFWIEMLCIMHEGTPIGHLTLGGKPATLRQMAANAYCSEKEAKKYLDELEQAGVFSRKPDGTIYSRRMVKDAEVSEAGREWGKTGGNPQLKQKRAPNGQNPTKGVNPPLNPPVKPIDNLTLIHGDKAPGKPTPITSDLTGGVKLRNKKEESEGGYPHKGDNPPSSCTNSARARGPGAGAPPFAALSPDDQPIDEAKAKQVLAELVASLKGQPVYTIQAPDIEGDDQQQIAEASAAAQIRALGGT